MAKLPWMKWYAGDWLNDPQLSLCTPATRGVWSDLVSAMHLSGQTGELSGTCDQLARAARCSAAEMAHALTDLKTTGAADVTERNGNVTVVNRRMSREHKKRQANAARQDRFRQKKKSRDCDDGSPDEKREVRSQKSYSSKNPSKRVREPKGSGVSKQNRTDLTPESLADQQLLGKWFHEECRRADGWLKDSEANWHNVQAVAAKVLNTEGIRDPVAVAKWIIRGNAWSYISATHEDMARAAAAALCSSPVDPIVAALAAAFKLKEV